MDFNDLSKKIYNTSSIKDNVIKWYKTEDDVNSLRSIISDLIDAMEDIEYNFSSCEDEYQKVVSENNDLDKKYNELWIECNQPYPSSRPTVLLNVNDVSALHVGLPNGVSFLEEYGLEMIDTQIFMLEKLWVYSILNEKKWMLAKIKHGI